MIKFSSKNESLIIKKEDFINVTEYVGYVEINFYSINSYGKRTLFSKKVDVDFFEGLYVLIDKEWVKI
jgi:hypothetical protein